jgi:hypothetical protein
MTVALGITLMPALISFGQMFRPSPQLSLPAYLDPM